MSRVPDPVLDVAAGIGHSMAVVGLLAAAVNLWSMGMGNGHLLPAGPTVKVVLVGGLLTFTTYMLGWDISRVRGGMS